MSRLEGLKNRRRKNILKTIATCLAITLVIASTQTMSTYSWFTSQDSVNSGLTLKTGSIGVDAGNGFEKFRLSKGNVYKEHSFKITNTGTLKQNLTLELTCSDYEIAKNINYELKLSDSNNKSIGVIGSLEKGTKLSTLINNPIKLMKENQPIKLNSGDYIKADVRLSIDNSITDDLLIKLSTWKFEIKLSTMANQINIQDMGFRGIDTQTSYLTTNLNHLNSNLTSSVNFENNKKTIKINTSSIKPWNKTIKSYQIEEGCSQEFSKTTASLNNNIMRINKTVAFDISDEFTDDRLVLKITYNDGSTEKWHIIFKLVTTYILGFIPVENLQAYYYKTVEVPSKSEVIEISKEEEIEVPVKQEVVEPSNEEVEVTVESEVVELPNEEEVPVKPEVIEPQKEEVVEPSESDAVVSNQTDIIAQKKEEDVE